MKKIVRLMAFLVLAAGSANAQFANRNLSNLLAPTAVNQDLLPNANNVRNLGSAAFSWKTLYLDNNLFLLDNLFLHGKGTRNTFTGLNSGFKVTSGTDLAAGGTFTLYNNTTGSSNTAFGSYSLFNNTTSSYNTGFGFRTLFSNTTGHTNTAVGYRTLYQNLTGTENVGIGKEALFSNTTGHDNLAGGFRPLFSNTDGRFNIAFGYRSMYSNTTGSNNTALGHEALFTNTTSSYNVAVGYQALYYVNNATVSYNTAVGSLSQFFNATGESNSSLGWASLNNNSSGSANTAIGVNSLANDVSGSQNTAVGYNALDNTVANYNAGIGAFALTTNTEGSQNTGLGYAADVSAIDLTNATAVGNGAIATASNQVMLGNTSVTSVKAAGTFVIYSDTRFKKNVKQEVPGLQFINLLTPVTYTYDVHGMNTKINANRKKRSTAGLSDADQASKQVEEQAIKEKEKKVYTGFLAQDVEKAAAQLKFDFSGVYKPQNDNDLYGLSYSEFVVPLVKAVQELSASNEELKTRLQVVEKELASLKNGTSLTSAFIKQNSPNPFTSSTTIGYYIPASGKNAYIVIKDMKGSTVKTLNLAKGAGQLTVSRGSLAAGSYSYTLYIDGERSDTKQMLLK